MLALVSGWKPGAQGKPDFVVDGRRIASILEKELTPEDKNKQIPNCLNCLSDHVFPFEFTISETIFVLNEKPKRFGRITPHARLNSHPAVCLRCGYIWAEIDLNSLKDKVKKFEAQTTAHECLRCMQPCVYYGNLKFTTIIGLNSALWCIPQPKFKLTLSDTPYLTVADESWACSDCGRVWSTLSGSINDLHMQIKKWSQDQNLLTRL